MENKYKRIKDFRNFLMSESLSVNDDVKKISTEVFRFLTKKPIGNYVYDIEVPKSFKTESFHISIVSKPDVLGRLLLNKSYKKDDRWIISLEFNLDPSIDTIYHEINHAYQMVHKSKEEMIRKTNYLTTYDTSYYLRSEEKFTNFFNYLYLSSDTEVDSKIIETYAVLDNLILGRTISSEYFIEQLHKTEGWKTCNDLMNYKTDILFSDLSKNDINKFFYIIGERKERLDKLDNNMNTYLKTLTMFLGSIKRYINNNIDILFRPDYTNVKYSAYKNDKYYERYINNQGIKMKRKLLKLYDLFKLKESDIMKKINNRK